MKKKATCHEQNPYETITNKTNLDQVLTDFLETHTKNELYTAYDEYPSTKTYKLDYSLLEIYKPSAADFLLENPDHFLKELKKLIPILDPQRRKPQLNPRIKNLRNTVQLKKTGPEHINKLVVIKGIIKRTGKIKPRLKTATFKCRSCALIEKKEQKQNTDITQPAVCPECGGKNFKLLPGESDFVNSQKIILQEPLEEVNGTNTPKQIMVILEDDLVDKVAPGNQVQITGIIRATYQKKTREFRYILDCNNIQHLDDDKENVIITVEEEQKIREYAEKPDIYQRVIDATAPSIHGYDELKLAIALQLFGGTSQVLPDKTKIRGNIHILIVGDPGIGKSQILTHVNRLAPRGLYTSGKGTSGVGLTAAAVRDESGDWTLEAGALVLGDKGFCCIDELDKMREDDRSAIHEALEQQTVSIAKAGIMTTLNSRCSVLAASNPKFSVFDQYKTLAEQINLPPTILSRFDLIFIIEDKPDTQKDMELARKLLTLGQTINDEQEEDVMDTEFLRKYIAYSHKNVKPAMTQEASDMLVEYYLNMRNISKEENTPIPITPRQLEALRRLSEASARVRLSDRVTVDDAQRAIDLQTYCLTSIGTDPETGKVDVARVEGRTPKTQRDKLRCITETLGNLEDEYEGPVRRSILFDECTGRMSINGDEFDELLNIMKNKSIIYQPVADHFKLVQK